MSISSVMKWVATGGALAVALAACNDDKPARKEPTLVLVDAAPMKVDAGPSSAPDAAADAGGDGPGARDGGADAAALPGAPALRPTSGRVGVAVMLELTGTDFAMDAAVHFDGKPVPTMWHSEKRLVASVPAELTAQAGYHGVTVGAGAAPVALTYYVGVPMGWPEVIDFRPDNGVAGDKIEVIGYNLTAEALRIGNDAGQMATSGRIGTRPGRGTVFETTELTIPAGWKSGPLVITSAAGSFRTKVLNVGRNLTRLPGSVPTASSEYGEGWTITGGVDNDLWTSWFPSDGDCVSRVMPPCKQAPWFMVTFAAPQTVGRIAYRGTREYASGYDILRARFEVLGAAGAVLWSGTRDLPQPDRDLDVALPAPVAGATAVRVTSERDESGDPGFGELEIFE